MQDVMLDLETMGNTPNAAIIAIGAVAFDPGAREIGDKFYITVDLESSVACGGVIDASTVIWWMQQGDAARAEFAREGAHIAAALGRFGEWVLHSIPVPNNVRMWGNGAAFDNVILASAYRRAGLAQPWNFWNDRCYRTVKAAYPEVNVERSGTSHKAIDDAEYQARHLLAICAHQGRVPKQDKK